MVVKIKAARSGCPDLINRVDIKWIVLVSGTPKSTGEAPKVNFGERYRFNKIWEIEYPWLQSLISSHRLKITLYSVVVRNRLAF